MPTAPTTEARQRATEATLRPDVKITRVSTEAQKKVARLQEKVKEEPRVAIEDMATAEPIDPAKIAESQENYQFKKADGSADTTTYAAQKSDEKTAVDSLKQFVETGVVTGGLEQKVLDHLVKDTVIKKQLEAFVGAGNSIDLGNADVRGAVTKILENPVYVQSLRDALSGALSESTSELGDTIASKERAYDEAKRKWQKSTDELVKLEGSVTTPGSLAEKTNKLNTEFVRGAVGGPPTKADTIANLEANEGTLNRELSVLQAAQDKDNTRLAALRSQRDAASASGKTGDATIAQRQIDAIETAMRERETLEIKPRDAQVQELNNLRHERDSLKKEVEETIPARIEQLKDELVGLNEQKFATQADFDRATLEFKDAVNGRVKGFQEMAGAQAVQFVKAEIAHAQNIEQTRLQKAIEKAEAAGDKQLAALLKSVETRWDSPRDHKVAKWKNAEIKPDEAKVKPDLDVLFAGGPEELGKQLFLETVPDPSNPGKFITRRAINPETKRAYKDDEIKAAMEKEGFKQVQEEAVQRVLGKALELGLVNKDNAQQILQTTWGVDALKKAREWNKSVDEQLKLFEKKSGIKNILDPKNIAELTKKNKKFSLWLLLTMLSPGLGFIVGSGLLTKSMISSGGEHGEKAH